jgi:hypothetical protein
MSLQEFSRSRALGLRAEQLSYALFFGPPRNLQIQETFPFGTRFSILGVGVYYFEGRDTIVAFVNESSSLREGERMPLLELKSGREALSILFGDNVTEWSDCYALGIAPPELHLTSTDSIVVSQQQGSCGAPVTWGNNHQGILTAGHVAQQLNNIVTDVIGNQVGTVVGLWDAAQSQTGADIAVIELSSTNFPVNNVRFNGPQKITKGLTKIDLHLPSGKLSEQVLGNAGWLTFPSTNGTYLDLYLTGNGITQGGDSGSAVTLAGTNNLIGHVIAGTGTLASVIQDAQYQLSVIATAPIFTNISL